jgi:hypothetical protein
MHRGSLHRNVSLSFLNHETLTTIMQNAIILGHNLISQNHIYLKQQIHDKAFDWLIKRSYSNIYRRLAIRSYLLVRSESIFLQRRTNQNAR